MAVAQQHRAPAPAYLLGPLVLCAGWLLHRHLCSSPSVDGSNSSSTPAGTHKPTRSRSRGVRRKAQRAKQHQQRRAEPALELADAVGLGQEQLELFMEDEVDALQAAAGASADPSALLRLLQEYGSRLRGGGTDDGDDAVSSASADCAQQQLDDELLVFDDAGGYNVDGYGEEEDDDMHAHTAAAAVAAAAAAGYPPASGSSPHGSCSAASSTQAAAAAAGASFYFDDAVYGLEGAAGGAAADCAAPAAAGPTQPVTDVRQLLPPLGAGWALSYPPRLDEVSLEQGGPLVVWQQRQRAPSAAQGSEPAQAAQPAAGAAAAGGAVADGGSPADLSLPEAGGGAGLSDCGDDGWGDDWEFDYEPPGFSPDWGFGDGEDFFDLDAELDEMLAAAGADGGGVQLWGSLPQPPPPPAAGA